MHTKNSKDKEDLERTMQYIRRITELSKQMADDNSVVDNYLLLQEIQDIEKEMHENI